MKNTGRQAFETAIFLSISEMAVRKGGGWAPTGLVGTPTDCGGALQSFMHHSIHTPDFHQDGEPVHQIHEDGERIGNPLRPLCSLKPMMQPHGQRDADHTIFDHGIVMSDAETHGLRR